MTEAQLATIETLLAVKLPPHYRRFLLEYPPLLVDTKLDLGRIQEAPADRQLSNDAARLIQLNRDVRLPRVSLVGDADDPWPDNYFVIGDDDCGNYWCVDLQTADTGVWFYDHEEGDFGRRHDGLREFGESLRAKIAAFNRQRRRA